MVDIIVAGHTCLDLLPGMSDVPLSALPSPGRLLEVDALDISTGGCVPNTGLAMHVLGADVGLMGKVGGDLIGRMIITFLNDRDPALSSMIQVEESERSSYTIALSPENSDRIFLHCTGTNDTFGLADIDFEAVAGAKIFHFGYPPLMPRMYLDGGEELAEIFRQAREAGAITSMDTAQPDPNKASGQVDWAAILPKLLPHVDIFIPSVEEIMFMLRREDFDAWGGDILKRISRDYLRELADELIGMGLAVTGFKLSYYGLYLRTAPERERVQPLADKLGLDVDAWTNAEVYHPAFQTRVVGTTGAGDSTYAALLVGMVKGLAPDDAARMACAVGGFNVEGPSAIDGLRSWQEIEQRVNAGWQTRADRIE